MIMGDERAKVNPSLIIRGDVIQSGDAGDIDQPMQIRP